MLSESFVKFTELSSESPRNATDQNEQIYALSVNSNRFEPIYHPIDNNNYGLIEIDKEDIKIHDGPYDYESHPSSAQLVEEESCSSTFGANFGLQEVEDWSYESSSNASAEGYLKYLVHMDLPFVSSQAFYVGIFSSVMITNLSIHLQQYRHQEHYPLPRILKISNAACGRRTVLKVQ